MKIYLLVHMRSALKAVDDWTEPIRGVFSSLELAQAAFPGEWEQLETTYWERDSTSISRAFILEYEVDAMPQVTITANK